MKKRKKKLKNYRREVENGRELGGRTKKRRQESVGSVGTDRGYLTARKQRRMRKGAEGLHLIRGFRNKNH